MTYALLFSVFVIASCGLVYELVAAALASYLVGDSVTQFSTIIGTYLFAMGIGSYLSSYLGKGLIHRFILIELCIGLIGGFTAAVLFLSFSFLGSLSVLLYTLIFIVGVLVGLEIPLLLRILKEQIQFKDLVAQVLTFDYLGALIVSILFPVILAPKLGLIRTGFFFGLMNALVAGWTIWLFRERLPGMVHLRNACIMTTGLLMAGFVYAGRMTDLAEENLYADEIIFASSSPYQRIVLTRWKDDIRLHLNNHLQFSSRDEYRYHEALVHPGLSAVPYPRRVLVLGGGDGLAIREVLKYDTVEAITLVDLDEQITQLFSTNPMLTALNQNALGSPKVTIVNDDAFIWLEQNQEMFDFVVVDFPDPSNYSLGKLYTTAFYKLLRKHVSEQGIMAIQSTSSYFAPRSFWCIAATLESVGFQVNAYHTYVPSFGDWGFVIASQRPYQPPESYPDHLKYLTPEIAKGMFVFPEDMQPVDGLEVNRLSNQILTRYFEEEWRQVVR